jgi:hypothetical protein
MSNSGFRIIIDQRGPTYWWSFTQNGQRHEASRGYSTLNECVDQVDLHRRLLRLAKMREADKAKAANQ